MVNKHIFWCRGVISRTAISVNRDTEAKQTPLQNGRQTTDVTNFILFFCEYTLIKGVIILFVAKIDLVESIYITSFTPSTQETEISRTKKTEISWPPPPTHTHTHTYTHHEEKNLFRDRPT